MRTKTERAGAMLRRKAGATSEEICKRLKWSRVSIQEMGRANGLALMVDRTARPYRYWGLAPGEVIDCSLPQIERFRP